MLSLFNLPRGGQMLCRALAEALDLVRRFRARGLFRALLGGNREPEPQTAKTRRSGGSCIDGRGKAGARLLAETSFPYLEPDFKRRFRATGGVCPEGRRFPGGCCSAPGEALPAISNLSDADTGTIGRRPSGARLYHRGSRFGDPERRKLDRNLVARILFLAEALDRRTRGKGQHGGLLKAKGLDVLRALLRRLLQLSHRGVLPEP